MPTPETLRTYTYIINKLVRDGVYPNPLTLTPKLHTYLSAIENAGTRKMYISALLNKVGESPARAAFKTLLNATFKLTKDIADSQELPAHRQENFLAWPDVLALKDKAQKLSAQNYLIYCLYTMNPPVRADYSDMLVLKSYSKKYKDDIEKNYLILNDNKSYFVFNVYKVSKKMGQVIVPTSSELHAILKTHAPINQKLLGDMTPNALTKRVISIFDMLSGKAMGIGLLRHSYITAFLSTQKTIVQKQKVAMKMMHSWATQERYHIISSDEE